MSLSKNQRELLKIAKTLVCLVLDEGELAQDEDENLNHVKHLLDWHTTEKETYKVEYKPNRNYGKTFHCKRYEPLAPFTIPTEEGSNPIGPIKYGRAVPWSEEDKDDVVYASLAKKKGKINTMDGFPCPKSFGLGECTCLA